MRLDSPVMKHSEVFFHTMTRLRGDMEVQYAISFVERMQTLIEAIMQRYIRGAQNTASRASWLTWTHGKKQWDSMAI